MHIRAFIYEQAEDCGEIEINVLFFRLATLIENHLINVSPESV